MAIGLSTYAFFWRASPQVPQPLSLPQMLQQTAALGISLFQICDYPAIETWSDGQLSALRRQADELGITLELGTRGLATDHLRRYLHIAGMLDAKLIRSMLYSATLRPNEQQAFSLIETILPAFERQQVALCLETYEQVKSCLLMTIIQQHPSRYLGICLDPANCVAALELPEQVIENTASRVLNLHVKDFTFSRRDGWVGFTLAGCPLGEGLLDYDAMVARLRPVRQGINQIVEHWLPWQGNAEVTCQLEAAWTRHNIAFLQTKQNQEQQE
ncbi:sugar phosphate isomerase [Erwinia sp. OLTSP20]|uniref:sugar phosphate isomerase/epimerase family protein n=1 Tax=unclassified Erwinia TaxID=2622719 RepID=UPI000C181655|nr:MULTISPECIES: TIM barrel protein [unclassified Erwinia]PIJ51572.1 sugar phosphate isomerase [Erwinia sp. OAMSP11]PIJ75842.1 sugar phosphate isomerase [Erwinia sp. OLSSP12]PIJ83482.1 sugar phosphate isomerase [Erwinia sp. OLCASP19]PIJ86315.1 sugar phosphate isomerase [Erwinia sp. OLMTSP26]PIJ88442.1 sugar phosphate isomerase [Erwinia sp. OLMDSP33]